MSDPVIGVLGFASVILLLAVRVPVAIAMGVVGAIGYGVVYGFSTLGFVLGRSVFDSIARDGLSIVPLFVMMGVFAAHGGLSRRLYDLVASFVGHWRGGLAVSTIGASAIFGAICGSSVATAATMGRIAMPEMRRFGYDDRLASAAVAAGGTLGIMIPPSIMFVIYGLMTETSIGKLFIAGIIPGICGTILYATAVGWVTTRHPDFGPASPKRSWDERLSSLGQVWAVVVLFGVVLGGLYIGLFTPTEAASVGAFGAITLTAVTKQLTWRVVRASLVETALTTGMIFFILVGATVFNYFIDATGLTHGLISAVSRLSVDRYWILALLFLVYVVLGCFMDSLSMILLTIGSIFPLITALGFNSLWFGVVLVTLGEIATITPPVGMNLFVLSANVPNLKLTTVARGVLPFVSADLVRIVLLVIFPALATYLPSTMFR